MSARLWPAPSAQAAGLIARAVGAVGLAALAMIYVIDLPATLGPIPLVGADYLGIIAALAVETLLIVLAAWQLRIRALGPPRSRTEPARQAAPTCSHLG
jgi:hypothetical protein